MTLNLREPSHSLHLERERESRCQRAGTHPTADMKSGAARQVSTHEDTVLGNDRLTLKMLKMLVDFLNTSDLTKSSSWARVSSRWVMAQIPKQQARPWGDVQLCLHLGTVAHLPTCCVGRNVHPHVHKVPHTHEPKGILNTCEHPCRSKQHASQASMYLYAHCADG